VVGLQTLQSLASVFSFSFDFGCFIGSRTDDTLERLGLDLWSLCLGGASLSIQDPYVESSGVCIRVYGDTWDGLDIEKVRQIR
jgi:hypothetical protein